MHLFALILIAAVILIAGMYGITWWTEQPLRMARSLLNAKQEKDALVTIDEFLKSHRDHSAAIALKAQTLSRLGRSAEAVRLFNQVGAASLEEMKDCANAYLKLEQWAQAREVLEYLVIVDPDDADRFHELAACRAMLGQYDLAIEAARIFASKPGRESRGYLLIGILENRRGNKGKADEAWKRVLEINPEASDLQISSEEFFADYGSVLLDTGEPERARHMLSRSVETKETPRALSMLGNALMRLGKADEARVLWEKALTQDPKNETAILGLADLAVRASDFSKALELLKPVEESTAPRSAAAFMLSRVYGMAGNSTKADEWKSRFEQIRKNEEVRQTANQIALDYSTTAWGQILSAYRLAEAGNRSQARIALAPHVHEQAHPFVKQFNDAIENNSPLPSLDGVPVDVFH
jgi:Tfp pilus assembly protein PilF